MSTKKILLVAALGLLAVWGISTISTRLSTRRDVTVSAALVVDPNNACAVVGWSSNVFVAKVLREEGMLSDPPRPRTTFSVEVLTTIKGNTPKEIIVMRP